MDKNVFTNRLKALRKENRKRQQDMSDLLNIKRSTYGAYETGVITPPMEKIKTIADYFDVSVDYLIGQDVSKHKDKIIDISNNLNEALKLLESSDDIYFEGSKLDEKTRKALTTSFKSFIDYANLLDDLNKKK